MKTGLVSVSFRPLSPAQVLTAARDAGLRYIEWGSDVHAPCTDEARLREIAAMQDSHEITCSSYGTYFKLGIDPTEQLYDYIRAAKILGTDILRLWCYDKRAENCTPQEQAQLIEACRAAAAIAEAEGVTLCMECHMNSFTETKEGALELMQQVNSPAFRMYWQPNQHRTTEENLQYLQLLKDYTLHVHVFNWAGRERFPLADAIGIWKQYLSLLGPDHTLLLEFMPDDDVQSLPAEAAALFQIAAQ